MKNKKQWLSFILIILLLAIGLMASTSFENHDGPIDLPSSSRKTVVRRKRRHHRIIFCQWSRRPAAKVPAKGLILSIDPIGP
jgi:hypothetical protein